MSSLRLHFDPIWYWPYVVLATVAMGIAVWLGYRLARGLPGGRRKFLLCVRLTTMLLLLVAMTRPQLQWVSPEGERPRVWVMADASRSMGVTDGPGGVSRRQNLLQILDSLQSPLNTLAREVELERYDFAEAVELRETLTDTAEGPQTAMGNMFREAALTHAQRPLAAIFLLTDGAQRAVPPHDADPRQGAMELGELGVSLYPVPIGQSGSAQAGVDIAVEEIQVDPVVFEKKRVPVKVTVRWGGAVNRNIRVRLLLEDRSGLRAEQSGPLKPIPRSEYSVTSVEFATRYPEGSQVVDLSFTPEYSGEFKLAAEVEPLEGEVQLRNNMRETLITVRKGGLRVAYFDIFRTEVKSIRQLNASDKLQVDYQMMRSGGFEQAAAVDSQWFEPGRYDVFIIGDVSADQFGQPALAQLALRVRDGAGLMMLGGYHTYSAGGYAESPLRDLLPVQLNPAEKQVADVFARELQIQDELRVQPTAAGNRHYVTQIDSLARNAEAWAELPPFTGATRIRAKSDFVEVLATSQTGDHLIVSGETGRSRIMCLAFDQSYLWGQAGFQEAHRRFWRQAVLWLAHKELDTDQPIWISITPKTVAPGGQLSFEYGARDEQGVAITDAEFKVSVTRPDGVNATVAGVAGDSGHLATFTDTLLPGDYFVKVEALRNGNSVGFPAQSRFVVHDRDLELDNPIVDRGLLNELARMAGLATDSRVVNPEDLSVFLQDYLKRKPWVTQAEIASTWNLWDGWPLVLAFTFLMTLEWILRKQGGLV